MFHNINKGSENVIEKETAGENRPFLFFIKRNSSMETLYNMGLFHAFEQQPIDSCVPLTLERDTTQWLERAALSMSLPAMRFRISFGAGFSEKYHVSPLSILGHCFDVVSLGKALNPHMLHLTQLKISNCRTEMAMCMISSMRRNSYSTVCSPWSWYGTRMNRSSNQGVKM